MNKKTKENKNANKYNNCTITVIFILVITVIIYVASMILTGRLNSTSYASTQNVNYNFEKKQVAQLNSQTNSIEENIENADADIVRNESQYATLQSLNLNLDEIIEENNKTLVKEEIIKEEIDLEYTTKYTNNSELPKGMLQVTQDGVDGKQEVYIKKVYEGEELVREEKIGSRITKASINKIVEVGTGTYSSNYKVQVGDTLYSTPTLLAIRLEANENSEKIISISKNSQVQLLNKNESWYKVRYQTYIGWAKADCFTYLNPNSTNDTQTEIDTTGSNYTKQQLLNKLSFNMNLNTPSGFSLAQFKKIFANESKDVNKVFANNAEYFYYAEKQYNINGVFLAALAIHESGWANSKISNDKNNLFGYGAYDRSPYDSAYSFSNYSEGIDMVARVLVKYYLNPKGTKIYDGNTAVGTYYNGPTLSGVNKKYATDKNWANGVYSWMKYLYNNL